MSMAGEKLVHAAFAELASDPECLKAFVLSIACGLRRSEADKLEWAAFDFDRGLLHIGPTRFLHPKSEKSIGDVDLDEGTVSLFRGFHARLSSNQGPRLSVNSQRSNAIELYDFPDQDRRDH